MKKLKRDGEALKLADKRNIKFYFIVKGNQGKWKIFLSKQKKKKN